MYPIITKYAGAESVLASENNYKIDTKKCFANEVLEDHILNDRVEAVKKYDVNSTPTIIINEKKFEKPLTFKNLQKAIEKLL